MLRKTGTAPNRGVSKGSHATNRFSKTLSVYRMPCAHYPTGMHAPGMESLIAPTWGWAYDDHVARSVVRTFQWYRVTRMKRGILASVFSSCMFAAMYYMVTLMQPLTAQDVFAWRMTLTAPLVGVLITLTNDWPQVAAALRDVRRRPGVMLIHIVNAANVAGQMWVFLWAPLHGRALEASLGYFLMPLVMVLIGRFIYKEGMSRWQIAATILAGLGVAHEIWRVGSLSWLVLYIAIGFPLIFVMRRSFRTSGQGGAFIELNLIFVFALGLLIRADFHRDILTPELVGWILLIAVISATSMMAYWGASRWLPFSLFGLLSYLEPVLLVVVAYILGESVSSSELLTYGPIWLAVLLLVIEGATTLDLRKRTRRRQRSTVP